MVADVAVSSTVILSLSLLLCSLVAWLILLMAGVRLIVVPLDGFTIMQSIPSNAIAFSRPKVPNYIKNSNKMNYFVCSLHGQTFSNSKLRLKVFLLSVYAWDAIAVAVAVAVNVRLLVRLVRRCPMLLRDADADAVEAVALHHSLAVCHSVFLCLIFSSSRFLLFSLLLV